MGWLERRELYADAEQWQCDAIDLLETPGVSERLGDLEEKLSYILADAEIAAVDSKGNQSRRRIEAENKLILVPTSAKQDEILDVRFSKRTMSHNVPVNGYNSSGNAIASTHYLDYVDGSTTAFAVLPPAKSVAESPERGQILLHEATHGLQIMGLTGDHAPSLSVFESDLRTFRESQAYRVSFDALDVVYDGMASRIADLNRQRLAEQIDARQENVILDLYSGEMTEWFEAGRCRHAPIHAVVSAEIFGFDHNEAELPHPDLVGHYSRTGLITPLFVEN